MVRVRENVNQEPNIIRTEETNIIQQKKQRKELLNYMITLLNIPSENAGMCGLGLENSE
jgi:hypothetical protein